MSTEIIFEEEAVTEEVYRGTYIIDSRLTPKQQRRKIFNMMKQDGIKVENEAEYDIGYEGVSDNDGISETQETEFVVTRTYMKKIPYKITRDEIYRGTYILDGIRITPEEQRKKNLWFIKRWRFCHRKWRRIWNRLWRGRRWLWHKWNTNN